MVYVPDRQMIRMEGWHSGRQGAIPAVEIPLGEFLTGLGITLADCETAMQKSAATQPQMSMAGQPARRAASETAPPRPENMPSQAPPRTP